MKVSIQLDPGQSRDEAEEKLFKALSSQREGAPHEEDRFHDPAMEHLADEAIFAYEAIQAHMMEEILQELDLL